MALDGSADPWPRDPREALGGRSERELAGRVAAALALRAGLTGRPEVERDVEAPYAAAVVEGQVRLNPALLYLAAAPGRRASLEGGVPASSCGVAGGPLPLLGGLLLLLASVPRRRAHS